MKLTQDEMRSMAEESNRESISSMKMLGHMIMAVITLAVVCGALLAVSYWLVPPK